MITNNKPFKNAAIRREWKITMVVNMMDTKLVRINRYLKYLETLLLKYWNMGEYRKFWSLAKILVCKSILLRLVYIRSNPKVARLFRNLSIKAILEVVTLSLTPLNKWTKIIKLRSRAVLIPKANSTKMREIIVPSTPMRLIAGVLSLILGLICNDITPPNQFAFVATRSVFQAWRILIDRIKSIKGNGGNLFLYEYDIANYFPSITKDVMNSTLKSILKMNSTWIGLLSDIKIRRENKWTTNLSGCAPGFSHSPVLSNLVLHTTGFYDILPSGNAVVQFCDDGLSISDNENDQISNVKDIEDRLPIGIKISKEKSRRNDDTSGNMTFKFLGFTYTDGNIYFTPRSGANVLVGNCLTADTDILLGDMMRTLYFTKPKLPTISTDKELVSTAEINGIILSNFGK